MLFFKKKDEVRAESAAANEESASAEVLFSMIFGGQMTPAKVMEIPAAARCVNMIAYAVSALPVKLYRRTADGVEEITDDPRLELLGSRTGDTLNASEQRFRWVQDYLLHGSAYGYYEHGYLAQRPKMFYVDPLRVSIKSNKIDPIHKDYTFIVNGKEYYPHAFLKILRCTDGYGKGRGIVSESSLAFSVAYSTMKLEEKLVQKGGNKKGFLKAEKKLSDGAMEALRTAWRKLYSNEGDGCIILNDGMDFKEASSTNVEMQLNENKKSNAAEIMSLFGTSDGILSEATVKNAVMPVLDAFEAAFDADLLEESEKGEYYFAFDTRELTRGDIAQRYNAYAVALDRNFMQLDEVRALEDLPPLGVNFIKLGLNDVLLNPATGQIYTPNTNAWADFGEGAPDDGQAEDTEMRFNPYHDPQNGRFTTANGSGGVGGYVLVSDRQGRTVAGQKFNGGYVDTSGGNAGSSVNSSQSILTSSGNNAKIEMKDSKESKICEKIGIQYNEVKSLSKKLTDEQIIERVGGGDLTDGSCASVALAYVGNKAGIDVLDFRGGESENHFSYRSVKVEMCNFPNVEHYIENHTNDYKAAKKLLPNVQEGKEYYFVTGKHAAIVRRNEGKLQYLELQTPHDNGFKDFTNKTLSERFGCQKSHSRGSFKRYAVPNILIDVDSLGKSPEFHKVLGYINTSTDTQMKGEKGHAK